MKKLKVSKHSDIPKAAKACAEARNGMSECFEIFEKKSKLHKSWEWIVVCRVDILWLITSIDYGKMKLAE